MEGAAAGAKTLGRGSARGKDRFGRKAVSVAQSGENPQDFCRFERFFSLCGARTEEVGELVVR